MLANASKKRSSKQVLRKLCLKEEATKLRIIFSQTPDSQPLKLKFWIEHPRSEAVRHNYRLRSKAFYICQGWSLRKEAFERLEGLPRTSNDIFCHNKSFAENKKSQTSHWKNPQRSKSLGDQTDRQNTKPFSAQTSQRNVPKQRDKFECWSWSTREEEGRDEERVEEFAQSLPYWQLTGIVYSTSCEEGDLGSKLVAWTHW